VNECRRKFDDGSGREVPTYSLKRTKKEIVQGGVQGSGCYVLQLKRRIGSYSR